MLLVDMHFPVIELRRQIILFIVTYQKPILAMRIRLNIRVDVAVHSYSAYHSRPHPSPIHTHTQSTPKPPPHPHPTTVIIRRNSLSTKSLVDQQHSMRLEYVHNYQMSQTEHKWGTEYVDAQTEKSHVNKRLR
jgi:hypothetical protein